jgi:histidine phosphotransferase ChpT
MANGLELLAEEHDDEMRARIVTLLEQSAKASADKLKFFRLAFGAADGFAEDISVEDPRGLIDALAGNPGRITVNWALGGTTLPKPAVKLLLNMALIGIEALVRGGALDIGAERRDGSTEIVVRASGSKIAFDPTTGQALDGTLPDTALTSRVAVAALAHRLITGLDGSLQYALTDDALVLGAVLPVG